MRNSDSIFNVSFLWSFKDQKLIQVLQYGIFQGMIYNEDLRAQAVISYRNTSLEEE